MTPEQPTTIRRPLGYWPMRFVLWMLSIFRSPLLCRHQWRVHLSYYRVCAKCGRAEFRNSERGWLLYH